MDNDFFKIRDRRDFLKKCLRTVTLGGLGFIGLALGLRKGSHGSIIFTISPYQQCQGCSKAFECKIIKKEPKIDSDKETKNCPLVK